MCGHINDQSLSQLAMLCNRYLECAGFSVFEEPKPDGRVPLPMFCLKSEAASLESRAASTMPSLDEGFYARSEYWLQTGMFLYVAYQSHAS